MFDLWDSIVVIVGVVGFRSVYGPLKQHPGSEGIRPNLVPCSRCGLGFSKVIFKWNLNGILTVDEKG